MSNRTIQMNDELYQYLLNVSVQESPAQLSLRKLTLDHEYAQMQIAPEQGQFMALLVKLLGAQNILEIGTFTGYSALSMAQALPEDGSLVCCDVSEEWTSIGKPYWQQAGVTSKIDLRIAPALETLEQMIVDGQSARFDMAFIDADKTNYANYFEYCLTLVRTNGLIMFDNTLWNGSVADPANTKEDTVALRALNEQLKSDPRVDISMLPLGDGLTLARVK